MMRREKTRQRGARRTPLPGWWLAASLRAAIAALAFASLARAGMPPPRPAPAPAHLDVLRAWGWSVAQNQNLAGVEMSAAELATFRAGAERQLRNQPSPARSPAVFADVESLATARRAKIAAAERARHLAAAQRFFAQLDQNPHISRLPNGLRLEILAPGQGNPPRPHETAVVHYVGRRIDGSAFVELGPYEIVLVPQRVSPALFAGLQQLAPGARARLYVPPALSAGEETRLGIAPGTATVYDVELLATHPTAPDDLANALLPPAPEPPPPPPSGAPESEIIATWGWVVAEKLGAAGFQLSGDEIAAFLEGLTAGIRGDTAPRVPPAVVRNFVAEERQGWHERIKRQRTDAMNALFAKLDRNPAVTTLPSGLRYEILQPGRTPRPRPGQIAVVDYVGRLLNGTVFDRTDNEPLHIQVGSVIAGFNEGIQQIGVGGRIRLYVPPALGYGDEDVSGVVSKIPAYSTLIYEINLLRVDDADRDGGEPSAAHGAVARR